MRARYSGFMALWRLGGVLVCAVAIAGCDSTPVSKGSSGAGGLATSSGGVGGRAAGGGGDGGSAGSKGGSGGSAGSAGSAGGSAGGVAGSTGTAGGSGGSAGGGGSAGAGGSAGLAGSAGGSAGSAGGSAGASAPACARGGASGGGGVGGARGPSGAAGSGCYGPNATSCDAQSYCGVVTQNGFPRINGCRPLRSQCSTCACLIEEINAALKASFPQDTLPPCACSDDGGPVSANSCVGTGVNVFCFGA